MMEVKLSYAEMNMAYTIGAQRQIYNMKLGTSHKWGLNGVETAIASDLVGCAGELAVAKALNLYWDVSSSHKTVDVGGMVEVRTVTSPNRRLILHETDKPNLPYVLVYSKPRTTEFLLKGWLLGQDGIKEEYWSDPQNTNRHAYFVPDSALRPVSELVEWVKNGR